ncbi:MAG: hypothetical protein MJZ04_00305 [Bacteroidales bacterium]|nr:hypothetical protein [Bacteroidales bacterium]
MKNKINNKYGFEFFPIPKTVALDRALSSHAKLVLGFLLNKESYFIEHKGYHRGDYIYTYYNDLVSILSVGKDMLRKRIIPELKSCNLISVDTKRESADRSVVYFSINWNKLMGSESPNNSLV